MVKVKGCTASFSFFRPHVQSVFIVGSFNDWRVGELPMHKKDGYWKGQLHLKPGVYQFRYFADGHWYTDYASFGVEMYDGNCNSVLRI
jgi:1,4-alpha-glucan branching enzyme